VVAEESPNLAPFRQQKWQNVFTFVLQTEREREREEECWEDCFVDGGILSELGGRGGSPVPSCLVEF
jgi:hypothetical protein